MNPDTYSQVEARKRFMNAYVYASDFSFCLAHDIKSIRSKPKTKLLKCLEYCDLIYVLNLVEWEICTQQTRNSVGRKFRYYSMHK